jgi:hypothetical protein
MEKVGDLAEAFNWSISKISEAFSMDRATVRKKIVENDIQAAGSSRGNPTYALKDVAPVLFAGTCKTDEDIRHDPSLMIPKERKDWFQSENERIKLEKEQRNLIPVNEVVTVYSAMTKAVVQVLETIPDILERDCALTPQAVSAVQASIDDLRTTLSERSYHACAIDLMRDKGEVIAEED